MISLSAVVLMHEMHFKIESFTIDCVFRRCMQMELKWLENVHRAVGEGDIVFTSVKFHL